MPHSTVYPDEMVPFTMTQEINVVVETGIDQVTKEFLGEVLTDYRRTMTTSAVRTDLFEGENSTGAGKYGPYMLVADMAP